MCFAEARHLPPPGRVTSERQNTPFACLARNQQRMFLCIVPFGQHLSVRLELAALNPVRTIQRRQLIPHIAFFRGHYLAS